MSSPHAIRRRALLSVVAALTAAALVGASSANAYVGSYGCPDYPGTCLVSPGWDYAQSQGVPLEPWDYNEANYTGSGSFDICAALRDHQAAYTYAKSCHSASFNDAGAVHYPDSVAHVSICNFGTYIDAGIYNGDNGGHHIWGYADTAPC